MSSAAQVENIVSSVNEKRFLEHIRNLFTTSATVLAECLQNGRRAGATRIEVDCAEGSTTVVITDNGCGIADFRLLVSLAESGWDEAVMASDRPYGIGFFSTAFAAERVQVESRGRMIDYCADDLIQKHPIAVQPSSFIGGTRVTLVNCRLESSVIWRSMNRFAKGFSVPVYLNGNELPRPHAKETLPGQETDVGYVYVPGVHSDTSQSMSSFGFASGVAYCQGLPVNVGLFSDRESKRNPRADVVVHVDHTRFQPRMPDRDCLIDSEAAGDAFKATIRSIWKQFIVAQKSLLPPNQFAKQYWQIAKAVGCLDVMNDVPCIPSAALSIVDNYPEFSAGASHYFGFPHSDISKDDVVSGKVVLCADFDYEGDGADLAKLTFCKDAGFLLAPDCLPQQHWAQPYLVDLRNERIRLGGRVIASGGYSGDWTSATVKLIQDPVMVMAGRSVDLQVAVVVGKEGGDQVIVVPYRDGQTPYCGWVVKQLSAYTDEWDSECETDRDLDGQELSNVIAILAGEDPLVTLNKCLSEAGAGSKSNLQNKAFLVRFDEDGNVTVTAA